MRRKISFIIGAAVLAGILAVCLRFLPGPVSVGVARLLPQSVLSWLAPTSDAPASDLKARDEDALAEYVIGPQKEGVQEIRVWAIRGGTNYGWIQLPKGTPVHLLREEGSWLVVRYDESVLKVHRSVAESGLVVPVTKRGRLASL